MQPPFKRVDHIHIKLAYYNISQVICINIATKFKDEGAGGLIKFYAAILKKIKQTHPHRQCTYIPFSITCILNLQYVYTYVIDMLYICSMFNVLGVTNRSNAISIGRMYCLPHKVSLLITLADLEGGGGFRGVRARPSFL